MKYDFNTVRKRFHSGSFKWDELLKNGVLESEDIIPFSVADLEFVTAPEIVDAIKHELDTSIMGYARPTDEYLKTVCSWFKNKHNWNPKPEWILQTHGVVDAFFEAVKTYTQEGDGVMLMTPVYYPMYSAVSLNNRVLIENKLLDMGDHYEIDFDDFERKASQENTKLLILCSPHNPCGRVWTKDELTKIGEICLKNNVLVISDEIHCDVIMPGYKHTIFASISDEFANNCVVCTSPSKSFNIAGLQISNIFIPNETLREKFFNSLRRCNPNPKCNILGYRACEAAYKNCSNWFDEALNVINTNKNIITDFINKKLPNIKVYNLEGTFLLWLNFKGLNLDYMEIERKNHIAKLFFDEGYIFGKQSAGYERWHIACPTRYIQEALERLFLIYK